MIKLRRNIRRKFLRVKTVWLFPSSAGHHHMFVFTGQQFSHVEQALWEMHLGSDIKRAAYNIMRAERGLPFPDLLIASRNYNILDRHYDSSCSCPEKHKFRRITRNCPILQRIHGKDAGAEYFAINRDIRRRDTDVILPYGRVPLNKILHYWKG